MQQAWNKWMNKWMNEWMKVQWFKVHSKARSRLSLTHLPVQSLSKVKSLHGPRVRVISPVVKEKVYGGQDLLKSQVLRSEWNTERVREDASGDSEDDEMPCVIRESAKDCVWWGSQRSVGSSFHREGAAYLKERFVIFKEEWVGGWARVTIDEERVLWQGWTEIESWRHWGWFVVRTL